MSARTFEQTAKVHVRFWALLGPVLLLVSSWLLLVRWSDNWSFIVLSLVALPLCIQWRVEGMCISCALLGILAFSAYQDMDAEERYWHIGMSLTQALSFLILALSLDEADEMVEKILSESKSRLDNVLALQEELKNKETVWAQEKEQLTALQKQEVQEFARIRSERDTFAKLAHLTKEEAETLHRQKELLAKECLHLQKKLLQAKGFQVEEIS